jgi:hypothetical protein
VRPLPRSSSLALIGALLAAPLAACSSAPSIAPAPRSPTPVVTIATPPPPPESARDRTLRELAAHPAWLFPADACPASVMPPTLTNPPVSDRACAGDALPACVSACEQGTAAACFNAALAVQVPGKADEPSEALFLRACKLGDAGGCTNRGAGWMMQHDNHADACVLQTFGRVCEEAGDPWGCTMLGLTLVKGDGVPRDLPRAKRALTAACRTSPTPPDEPCAAALHLLEQLASGAAP